MHLLYAGRRRKIPFSCRILTYDEILRICRCAADLGIRKIKLTGGEPLVRKGCASLAKQIKAITGIEKVTLTTNGILLAEQLDALLDAGIDAINISLDTLDPELFKKVARRDGLEKVFEGIKAALATSGTFPEDQQRSGDQGKRKLHRDCRTGAEISNPCAFYRDDANRIRKTVPIPG